MSKAKSKSHKKSKTSSKKVSKVTSKRFPGPIVTTEVIEVILKNHYRGPFDTQQGQDLKTRYATDALAAIWQCVFLASPSTAPIEFARMRKKLSKLPAGHTPHWYGYFPARQLRRFLVDQDAIKYVRASFPGCLGERTQTLLHIVVAEMLKDD